MTLFARLDPGDSLTRLALGALLQMTVAILLAAAAAGLALRRRAALRHNLWLGALIWVLLSPTVAALSDHAALSLGVVRLSLLRPGEAVVVDRTVPSPAPRIVAGTAVDVAASGPVAEHEPASRAVRLAEAERYTGREVILSGVCALWALGVMIGMGRIVAGWRRLAALTHGARPIDGVRHGATLEQVRAALGVGELPLIVTSPAAAGPLAAGFFRSCVVLPERLAGALTAQALRDVLVHECAHVLRRDPWVGLLQRLAGVLYWPHPLVHYLNAQLSRAREEVCDNHVLACSDTCGYARTLLALTELCRPLGVARAGLGFLGAHWTLAERVAGLLDARRVTMTRTSVRTKITLAIVLAAVGLVVASVRLQGPARADEPSDKQVVKGPAADTQRISGVVVDEQGRPVAGAMVRSGHDPKIHTRSAADGTFTLSFDGPLLTGGFLIAEADGGRSGLLAFYGLRVPDTARIVVKPTRPVLVRAKDAAGAPVPDAAVEALDSPFFHNDVDARTGPDGTALLRVRADANIGHVIAHKSGVGFDYFENERKPPASGSPLFTYPPLPAEVSLTLDGVQPLRVKALDSMDRPVAGVALSPGVLSKPGKSHSVNLGASATAIATTDASGVAVFDWLPKGDRVFVGDRLVVVRSEAYSNSSPPRHDRTVRPAEVVVLLRRNTRLSGVVRYADGRPARGIQIRAESHGPNWVNGPRSMFTGADGAYVLDVPPEQSYIIAVLDETWAAPSHTGVVVHEGQAQTGLDFTLSKGTLLHGRVTEGPDRKPSVNRQIYLREIGKPLPRDLRGGLSEEELLRGSARTDAEGRYQFRVGPGRYRIPESLGGDDPGLAVEVKDEAEIVRDIAFESTTNPGFLNGTVLEKTATGDQPLAAAWVYAAPIGRESSGGGVRTDAEGHFRLPRRLHSEAGLTLYALSLDRTLAGFSGVLPAGDNVTVPVAKAVRISGRVVDPSGKTLAGRYVQLRLDSGPVFATAGHFYRRLTTDAQGRFTYLGAPLGAEGELFVLHRDDDFNGPRTVVAFKIFGLEPVEVSDLVVPTSAAER
jgi:beta-lactamase regulating signal transducer with metallopeptidase domain